MSRAVLVGPREKLSSVIEALYELKLIHILDHRGEFTVFDTTPDQPPGRGLLSAELVAEQREPERARRADEAWQSPRATRIGHQTELREGLHEARRTRGDHQITGERNIGAGTGGYAIDRCNHGQRH